MLAKASTRSTPTAVYTSIDKERAEARFILLLQAEVSKRFYSSKAVSSNVPGVGTFSLTCSNLGQLSPYSFKHLYGHFSRFFNRKLYDLLIVYGTFGEISFRICVKFLSYDPSGSI
jgi:hypothetical protein